MVGHGGGKHIGTRLLRISGKHERAAMRKKAAQPVSKSVVGASGAGGKWVRESAEEGGAVFYLWITQPIFAGHRPNLHYFRTPAIKAQNEVSKCDALKTRGSPHRVE